MGNLVKQVIVRTTVKRLLNLIIYKIKRDNSEDIDMNKPTEAIWYSIEPFAREQILTNLDTNSIISIREVSNGQ